MSRLILGSKFCGLCFVDVVWYDLNVSLGQGAFPGKRRSQAIQRYIYIIGGNFGVSPGPSTFLDKLELGARKRRYGHSSTGGMVLDRSKKLKIDTVAVPQGRKIY